MMSGTRSQTTRLSLGRSQDKDFALIDTSFMALKCLLRTARSLSEILAGMAQTLPQVRQEYGNGVLEESILDADYFIAVARSLLSGNQVRSYFNQNSRVAETLDAIESGQLQEFNLFGRDRRVDFSQFKPRGHYEKSEALKRYFRAMIWCGRIDLRIAGNPEESSPRQLGIAIILNHLLNQSGKFSPWQQFDQMLQTFVGQTDSMTFAELNDFLAENAITSPTDIKTLSTLEQLQTDLLATPLGLQSLPPRNWHSRNLAKLRLNSLEILWKSMEPTLQIRVIPSH